MDTNIIINEDASAAYLNGQSILITQSKSKTKSASSPGASPDSPFQIFNGINYSGNLAKWGVNNLFPQDALAQIASNSIIKSTLDWKARALYQGGVVYGRLTYDDNGNEVFNPTRDPEIEAFLQNCWFNYNYLPKACRDFCYWYWPVPEIILSRDRSKIVSITAKDAAFSRWEKQNEKTGRIENLILNANWQFYQDQNSPFAIWIPTIDISYDAAGWLRRQKGYKYILPIPYPTSGRVYYPDIDWYNAVESGWVDVANEIVQFKLYLLKNQLTIKYHIEIPEYYWEWKYPNYKSLGEQQRKDIRAKEIADFNSFLQGSDKAGKSIITVFKFDPHTNKVYPGWKINVIDDKIKDGVYIEDSQEASSHILYSMGVDATLIGTAPGKGLGAGSGSDKRVAFNIYTSLNILPQDIVLMPLTLARNYNGWDPTIVFRMRNAMINTLDSVKETISQTPTQTNANGPIQNN